MENYFVHIQQAAYLVLTINITTMKQIAIIAALALSLIACTKSNDQVLQAAQPKAQFFSRVQYFKDNRRPATDTVWTMALTSSTLVDQYSKQNGYVYAETPQYVDKGVLWSK